jgi:AcrR family transcriptional regulator
VKKPVSPVTSDKGKSSTTEGSLASRVLAEGLGSVTGVVSGVHGALGALTETTRGARKAGSTDGRSSRWAAHRAARREELIDAAVVAISRHGAGVGMDQIAAVAKTSKPVIYRYFADKVDLYRAVSQRVVSTVLTTLLDATAANPQPRELIHASVDAYLGLLEENPELYRFVAQHPLIADGEGERQTDFSSVVAELISQQLAAHLTALDLDPARAHPWGEGIGGFISAASLWWLDHRDAMTREQLADYLASLLWGGAAGVYQYVGKEVDARPAAAVFGRSNA